ncbi:hypothetical protein MKW94_001875, partial [Papaver nudicaule]|nr:hypothetical protein [Papaver nudicaule]
VQVDMHSTFVDPDEPNTCESSDCTKRDEGNLLSENSGIQKSEDGLKVSSTSYKGILMPYLTR